MSDTDCYPWDVLKVDTLPEDTREVKRAYARRLKQIDRSNVDEFQQLQEAYQYALQIVDDKPQKETIRSMGFSNDTKEPFIKQHSLKNLAFSDEGDTAKRAALKDLTFTYEEDEFDEHFDTQQKTVNTPNIYDALADPKNLSLKLWQEILNQANLDNIQEKTKIELHILTILSDYVINVEGVLKFNNKLPRNLIAYLQTNFDFEKYNKYDNDNITNVILAFSVKYDRPYLSYFNQFILYGFWVVFAFILSFNSIIGDNGQAFLLLAVLWAAWKVSLKIMQSKFKTAFTYAALLALATHTGMLLFGIDNSINKSLFVFIVFYSFSMAASFSMRNFPNKGGFYHMSFCLFHGWHLSLIILVLPKVIRSLFVETVSLSSPLVIHAAIAAVAYGLWFLFSEEKL